MTKAALTALLHRVAIANDPTNVRKLIMQCMTALMKSDVARAGGKVIEQCSLAVVDNNRPRVVTMSMQYVIYNPALVGVAWRKAFSGALRLEPCRKLDDDATLADGVIALLGERPILTISALDDDFLQLQIGGFETSIVAHSGNLMDLSRQVIESGE